MIVKVRGLEGRMGYEHQEAGRYYRRVLGGLAWPQGARPGHLVVVAEESAYDRELRGHRLFIVAERESAVLADLHLFCRELRRSCQAEAWLANLEDADLANLFLRQNQELGDRGRVWLQAAAWGTKTPAATAFQLIRELTQPHNKLLHFPEDSGLAPGLLQVAESDLSEPLKTLPPVAALGYALADLVLSPPPMVGRMKHKTMRDYPGPFARRS